jgi:hypothetical protein
MEQSLEGRVFCPECHNEVVGESHVIAFGFQQYICRICQTQVTAPMSPAWRRGYWGAVIGLMALADLFLLRQMANLGMACLVLAALAVLPLVRNRQLDRVHRVRSRNIWLVELKKRASHPSESTEALV